MVVVLLVYRIMFLIDNQICLKILAYIGIM